MPKVLKITSNARTHQGNKRASNQDAFLSQPKVGLWIIADGMGGHHNGEYASQLLTETIDFPSSIQNYDEAIHFLKLHIRKKNFDLFHYAKNIDSSAKCGTTIVCLFIKGNKATILWVGDSRVYMLRNANASLECITEDHTVYSEWLKQGKIDTFHPMADKYKEMLSRVVGGQEDVVIDEKRLILKGDERFVLCSDGLTKELTDEQIEQIVMKKASPGVICEHLIESSLDHQGRDNITVCVVDIELVE